MWCQRPLSRDCGNASVSIHRCLVQNAAAGGTAGLLRVLQRAALRLMHHNRMVAGWRLSGLNTQPPPLTHAQGILFPSAFLPFFLLLHLHRTWSQVCLVADLVAPQYSRAARCMRTNGGRQTVGSRHLAPECKAGPVTHIGAVQSAVQHVLRCSGGCSTRGARPSDPSAQYSYKDPSIP